MTRTRVERHMGDITTTESGAEKVIRIGHSPDPDDAFMFHALTTSAFPTPGYRYVHELQDIESLNQRALKSDLEVSAVSIHAYPDIADRYALMNCGASMGEGYGPMVITKSGTTKEQVLEGPIAIPGLKTSAYMALRLCWGDFEVAVVPFDEIIPRVLDGTYRSGLIIHEGQLTYVEHDLEVLVNLGVWWSERTDGLPLPLGGNVVLKSLGVQAMKDITAHTKSSIEFAINNPEDALEFAKQWGRGIDDDTNRKFVDMYVNDRTIDYHPEGRESVRRFWKEGQAIGLIPTDFDIDSIEFIGATE